MLDRFYVPEGFDQSEIELPAEEAHHALHVLRKGPGDRLALFDGRGRVAKGRIARARRKTVHVVIEDLSSPEPTPARQIVLAVAFPKGERTRWLVEKATEIGVSRLIPLTTERSVVDPRPSRIARLRQTVIAACKQSGRNRLMEIDGPLTLSEWLEGSVTSVTRLACDSGGLPISTCLPEISAFNHRSAPQEVQISIGPEGGFSPSELAAMRSAGVTIVSLGGTILRIETAAIVAAGFVIRTLDE